MGVTRPRLKRLVFLGLGCCNWAWRGENGRGVFLCGRKEGSQDITKSQGHKTDCIKTNNSCHGGFLSIQMLVSSRAKFFFEYYKIYAQVTLSKCFFLVRIRTSLFLVLCEGTFDWHTVLSGPAWLPVLGVSFSFFSSGGQKERGAKIKTTGEGIGRQTMPSFF